MGIIIHRLMENIKFPKSVLIIVIFYCCWRFSYSCLKSLPLYFVDILSFEESQGTLFYHVYLMVIAISSMFGGIIADSLFGKFKMIFFGCVFTILGAILLSVITIFASDLPIKGLAILSIILTAVGFGCAKPCIFAFGGDQFTLPQEKNQLSLLFVFFCMASNIASLSSAFIIHVLRKDITCFGQLTCYPLVYIVPAVLITFSTVILLSTKRLYKVLQPQENIVLRVIKCVTYALYKKFKSNKKHQHWLDYADDKYELKIIEDIKSVSGIVKLFVPMITFWSLYNMQVSVWIYQASRMKGEVGGYLITPDQIQAINPLFVIISIPIFHSYIFPFLGKYCFLNTPLRKISVGGLLTALCYVISGIIELNLEPTYAITPVEGLAQLRIFNTINCNVPVIIDGNNFTVNGLDMWENVSITANGKKSLKYEAVFTNCQIYEHSSKLISGSIEVMENQATSWAITRKGLNYKYIDSVDKSRSGNPLVRALIYINDDFTKSMVTLNIKYKEKILHEIPISKSFNASKFKEVAHKIYDLYINDRLVLPNVPIKLGGVYTVIGYISNNTSIANIITVTKPNSLSIFWMIPQEITLSVSEIMVDVLMMEFAFSEAPTSMKALLQSCWLFASFFGNLVTIIITGTHFFKRKVLELFLYAALMFISMIIFMILATFYKYKQYSDDNSQIEDDSMKTETRVQTKES